MNLDILRAKTIVSNYIQQMVGCKCMHSVQFTIHETWRHKSYRTTVSLLYRR